MENASTEYSGHKVKKMVEHEKAKHSWEFLFINANMDAIAVAGRLGIDRGKVSKKLHVRNVFIRRRKK